MLRDFAPCIYMSLAAVTLAVLVTLFFAMLMGPPQ
jgi:hypothetical protein